MEKLLEIVQEGEKDNVEFKEYLTPFHLQGDRFQSLACQMNHRIIMGRGQAIYAIGVSDSCQLKGIDKDVFDETVHVLREIASEIGAGVDSVEDYNVEEGLVGIVEISKKKAKEHVLIGTAGHVDHGKSTLIGCLITGIPDDGDGSARIYLDILKHEIERGLSADLSFAVFGFKQGDAMKLKNPLNKSEKAWVVENADKLVSFVDTVGHEPWVRTTMRGLLGQKVDYGLLSVAANDGVTRTTREHLGILLTMDLPVIIAVTKKDMVDEEKVKNVNAEITKTLKMVGRIPIFLRDNAETGKVAKMIAEKDIVVPVIETSSMTLEGYDILESLLYRLPKRSLVKEDFLMYIDRLYKVTGVGTVLSGCIKSGEVNEGDDAYIGPFHDGTFKKVKVQSIEMHYYRVGKAEGGDIVGVAVKGVRYDELRRGMVLTRQEVTPVQEFEADLIVFSHPTRIKRGYEPVIHMETISETVVFEDMENDYMKAGDRGRVRMRFKYNPHCIFKGQKFIFREGRSKGMGEIKEVL
ncbi:MAG: GTPBP1 family GTP-binding protein [Archaeoglobaceae archaeon]